MSTLAPYHHPPLPSPHHIRLLELLTSSDQGAPLTGTIRVVNIVDDDYVDEDTLPYVALSYRWSQDASEQLLVNGKGVIRISQDLDAALRRFRYASALRWIWVDAISINQQDHAEKSIQIPLMPHIYRGASRVMIWLGNRSEDVDLLRRIKSLVRDVKACPEELEFGLHPRPGAAEAGKTLITNLRLSMSQLGRLAWFSRRWILQELALNANAVLCCAQTELPWPRLASVLSHSEANDRLGMDRWQPVSLPIKLSEDSGSRNIQLLWDLWWNTTMSPRPGLSHLPLDLDNRDIAALMITYSDFECSDNRDQIAALLGLSRDTQSPTAFRVDYADSVEQTYVKFAESLVRTGHLAWLLYQNFQREKDRGSRAMILPSWVPDWRSATVAPSLDAYFKYRKGPTSGIKASTNIHGAHLLTTDFWILPLAQHESRKSRESPVCTDVPATASAPFLDILWKSSLFPVGTGFEERVALAIMELWPLIVARLSEDARASRRVVWYRLLLQVTKTVSRGFVRPELIHLPADIYPTFGEKDANDLEELRRYISYLLRQTHQKYPWPERWDSEQFANCLVFCQQASDDLSTGSICGMGYVPAPFCDQVVVGDKVLWANLGHFRANNINHNEVELQWSRYIVREQLVAPEVFVDSAADGLESTAQSSSHGTDSYYNLGSNSTLVSPWVHEFIAPCQAFSSFDLTHLFFMEANYANRPKEVRSLWIR